MESTLTEERTGREAAPDHYWAAEADPKELIRHIRARRDDFYRYLQESGLMSRVYLNWRLYYGFLAQARNRGIASAIEVGGEEGELRRININEFRAVIKLLAGTITQTLPAWDTLAKNGDAATLEATKLGNLILDAYMDMPDQGPEQCLKRAVRHGLLLTAGYVWTPYDESLGDVAAADPKLGQTYSGGDIAFRNPHFHEVAYDWSAPTWEGKKWVCIRYRMNRWALVAEYPNLRDEILQASAREKRAQGEWAWIDEWAPRSRVSTDYIPVDFFYHVPCAEGGQKMEAIPGSPEKVPIPDEKTQSLAEGRYLVFVGDEPLEDGPLPEGHIPLARYTPDEFTMTSFGWTPAFDAQGSQEALDAVCSAILTNQNNLGPTKIWFKTGEPINRDDLEPGITVIQSETPPQALNFLATPPEMFRAVEMWSGMVEKALAVNATTRGAPPPNVKSGNMAALIDSRTQAAASELMANWDLLLAQVGTSILRSLKTRQGQRALHVSGKNKARRLLEFQTDDLDPVERVTVIRGNPIMRSIEGRSWVAQFFMQAGLIKTPEELETVLFTGDLSRLTETNTQHITATATENDLLLEGKPCDTVAMHQNHPFHILKHATLLDRPDVIRDPGIFQHVLAHITKHIDMLKDPSVQWLAGVLGYPQIAPPGLPQGMPGMPGMPALQGAAGPGGPATPPPGGPTELPGPGGPGAAGAAPGPLPGPPGG